MPPKRGGLYQASLQCFRSKQAHRLWTVWRLPASFSGHCLTAQDTKMLFSMNRTTNSRLDSLLSDQSLLS
jgi:hypothetical protein